MTRNLFVPRWSDINRLGRSRTVRSAYIWLFLVPLAARALVGLSTELAIPLWGQTIRIALKLPFSWKVFYYSAAAFASATFIYSLRCPGIVARYDKFSDFAGEGRGGRQIVREFLLLLFRPSVHAFEQERRIDHFATTFRTSVPRNLQYPEGTTSAIDRDLVFEIELPDSRLSDAFWYVRDYADSLRPNARLACSILYTIGFILIGVVIVQNFAFVAGYRY